MKKLYIAIVILFVVLVTVIIINTVSYQSRQMIVAPVAPVATIAVDANKAAQRLALAIQLPTISNQQVDVFNAKALLQLHGLIERQFPLVAAQLERRVINNYSLLYQWPGANPDLKPVTFLAHMDVVPAEVESLTLWSYAPFSGTLAEGFIWGRGAMDDKSSMYALLEAVEHLLAQSFVPQRTLYLAFGHDEEVGGAQGAAKIAEYMQEKSIHSLFTLDEGMVIVDAQLSPAKQATAIVGIAEKGYVSVSLTAKAQGGHSSIPDKISAIGLLAEAILALEENQMPASLDGPSGKMFEFIGPEMTGVQKMVFANRWLFNQVILSSLLAKKSTAALIRTTTAVTLLQAGVKENVLPSQATAVVNFRILPGNDAQQVLAHVSKVIDNDNVSISFTKNSVKKPASLVSASDTPEFLMLEKTVKQIFPNTLFTPGLVLGGTDSRHYETVADNNYRFLPYQVSNEDLARVHGVDERLSIKAYGQMIQFYRQLMLNVAQ
ncbi:MAG: M20/M25/M40 family metallo-hydrolase [Pseudomonadales bacterium]|nr:M20/M25/M40 family metallo-hydrolase [Pseudomonadales bacterium]